MKSFAKTRTPPESEVAGRVSGSLIWWVYGGLCYEGSASANARVRLRFLTQRRARRVPGGVTAVLAGGPGRFRLRHPRAAHGWVAHRLNCLEFTNAEANGARRYSSAFLFAPFFFGLPPHGWCIRVLHLEPIGPTFSPHRRWDRNHRPAVNRRLRRSTAASGDTQPTHLAGGHWVQH